MDVIVGTAGHIDHGKTALVKALTGTDADRLPEEKRRGITVDLGFAELRLDDVHIGFVDVPGHERFVKNMLAGASGIDLVLLVIAADEGVMPQTREHFDICRLLGIKTGIVIFTKTDLVDEETIDLARMDAADLVAGTFLEGAPAIAVSSATSKGLDELKKTLRTVALGLARGEDHLSPRLPIDRSFSVKGFGAVVTGTLGSGMIVEGQEMEILPRGYKVRVRGLQTHGKSAGSVHPGQRTAINLGGIDHSKISRGMVLAEPGSLVPTQMFDAKVDLLKSAAKDLRSRQRVRVHIGTSEALARIHVLDGAGDIVPGESEFVQLRLETPVVAVPGQRFILRRYSPQTTIAGGVVLDVFPAKHRSRDFLKVRAHLTRLVTAGENPLLLVEAMILSAGPVGLDLVELRNRTGLRSDVILSKTAQLAKEYRVIDAGGRYVPPEDFRSCSSAIVETLGSFHTKEPLAKGMSREALQDRTAAHLPNAVFQSLLSSLESDGKIVLDREVVRLASHHQQLSPAEARISDKIMQMYNEAGLEVWKVEEVIATAATQSEQPLARKIFKVLIDSQRLVKVTDEYYFSKENIDKLITTVRHAAASKTDRSIDVSRFKDLARVSRKYAIPLLEYFDRERVTVRQGDKRVVL